MSKYSRRRHYLHQRPDIDIKRYFRKLKKKKNEINGIN